MAPHVNGKQNPADLATHSIILDAASSIERFSLWFEGPSWLSLDKEEWPRPMFVRSDSDNNEESICPKLVCATTVELKTAAGGQIERLIGKLILLEAVN